MKQKRPHWFSLLLMTAALFLCLISLSRLEQGQRAEGKRQLEETLRRTAVACYASEGFYPPDLAYMQRHYGLTYDENSYLVYYDIYASNLMPDITVLQK